jgi:hypothetical protein
MFSYPKDEPRNRALVKIAGSDWSSVRINITSSLYHIINKEMIFSH